MQKLKFLGAAGNVTGSSYLLTGSQNTTLLIDLGMFQEPETAAIFNQESLNFDVSKLDGVVLTHGHLDHCGRLPLLAVENYKGKVYTTEATIEIATLNMFDSAEIAQKDKTPMLYTEDDVNAILDKVQIVKYDQPFSVGEFSITLRNAGHILGSASIEVKDTQGKIVVFSGDLGNTPQDLIPPTQQIAKADVVVMESTYSDTSHPQEDVYEIFTKEIEAIEKDNGVLLIPAFSIQRAQEIIHILGHLKQQNKINPNTTIFLDSPMAIKVTEIFENYRDLYNQELVSDQQPFNFDNLFFTEDVEQSKEIFKADNPKIIIAGSGMINGGRIMHHLKHYISLPTTRLLIVGYQAEDTLGREILNGAKEIEIDDQVVKIRGTVTETKSLSSHADAPKLLNWLKHIQGVKQVFLTHGEDPGRSALAELIKKETGISNIILPLKDEEYEIA